MAVVSLVIADAQGTPVNHTFVPVGPDKDGAIWFEDQSPTSPIGFWRVSYSLKRPQTAKAGQASAGRSFRAKVELHEPILEVVSNNTVSGIAPSPTVAYATRAFCEFVIPERAALLDRKNIRKMMALVLAEAQAIAMIETLIMPF